ncbi:MAG: 5-demethoxyubiquinol-8 5-hydroxylase UbiM [Burkholderiaceae bacterium]|nr:5-demethoxyubiquinol-8 5-hydroxylase UbiM [Burkholderiaceae bacterium]
MHTNRHVEPFVTCDVLIVGAGPAGLALAAALGATGMRVTLLEQQARAGVEEPADDGREIALTHRARRILEQLGVWQRVDADSIAPLREARVLDGNAPAGLRFAAEGVEALGWLVSNHRIRRAALDAALAQPSVTLVAQARVTALDIGPRHARVTLADGRVAQAALVAAADSRFSGTRRLAGIGASMRDFGRSVVVGCCAHERPHDGIAWECFGYANTLALLPMTGPRVSAVITVDTQHAAEWMALTDEQFARRVEQQAQGRLGAMHALGARHHYPLVSVYAHRFRAPRFALVGDAAVGMHPVTAHGYNFGLYGVAVLARELVRARQAGTDPGRPAALERYEREHRRATVPIYLGTNALVTMFTDNRGFARVARKAVLHASEHAPALGPWIRRTITRQLTGGGAGAGFSATTR